MGRFVTGLIGVRAAEGFAMVHSEEELKMLVTASQEAGVLEEQEEQMLHRVFDFADLKAGQAMVPRTELITIASDASGDALVQQIGRGGYAMFPVYKTDMDNVVGILHAIDVIKAMAAGRKNVTAAEIAREALTVPETMPADDLAGGVSASRRARSAGHRRIRRHGRSRHVRVVDGVDRRQRRHRWRRQDFGWRPMVRPRSTG